MEAGAVVLSRCTTRTPIRAHAVGLVLLSLACLSVLAQIWGTQGNLTEMTCEARRADAKEGSRKIKAAGSSGAWVAHTLVYLCLTAWTFEAWEALAMKGSRLVLALPTVGTGRTPTLIDVLLTPRASESGQADTQESVE